MIVLPNAKAVTGIMHTSDSGRLFGHGQLPLMIIESRFCHAVISAQNGQLLQFCPAGGKQWFWLGRDNRFDPQKPITGGIPLCLPWFGRPQDPRLPMHGFVQQRQWQLESVSVNNDRISCCWHFDNPADEPLFPHAFSVRQSLTLDDAVTLSLTVSNSDHRPMPLSWAWHSYFALYHHKATISGLAGTTYLDNTAGLARKACTEAPLAANIMDNVFETSCQPQFLADSPARHISGKNCPTCIIWQPGITDGKSFVCIERGCAFADSLTLAPGAQFDATMTITSPAEY